MLEVARALKGDKGSLLGVHDLQISIPTKWDERRTTGNVLSPRIPPSATPLDFFDEDN